MEPPSHEDEFVVFSLLQCKKYYVHPSLITADKTTVRVIPIVSMCVFSSVIRYSAVNTGTTCSKEDNLIPGLNTSLSAWYWEI